MRAAVQCTVRSGGGRVAHAPAEKGLDDIAQGPIAYQHVLGESLAGLRVARPGFPQQLYGPLARHRVPVGRWTGDAEPRVRGTRVPQILLRSYVCPSGVMTGSRISCFVITSVK